MAASVRAGAGPGRLPDRRPKLVRTALRQQDADQPSCQYWLTQARAQPRLTGMADTAQVASAAGSRDPAVGLRAVRSLRTLVERLEALQVSNARDQGWTWEQIAQLLGVTRQAVHKKYASGRGPLRRKD